MKTESASLEGVAFLIATLGLFVVLLTMVGFIFFVRFLKKSSTIAESKPEDPPVKKKKGVFL